MRAEKGEFVLEVFIEKLVVVFQIPLNSFTLGTYLNH